MARELELELELLRQQRVQWFREWAEECGVVFVPAPPGPLAVEFRTPLPPASWSAPLGRLPSPLATNPASDPGGSN
jgi:hypothetical protein